MVWRYGRGQECCEKQDCDVETVWEGAFDALTHTHPHHDFPNDLHITIHNTKNIDAQTPNPSLVTMAGAQTLDEMKQAFLVTLRGLQEKEQQLTAQLSSAQAALVTLKTEAKEHLAEQIANMEVQHSEAASEQRIALQNTEARLHATEARLAASEAASATATARVAELQQINGDLAQQLASQPKGIDASRETEIRHDNCCCFCYLS